MSSSSSSSLKIRQKDKTFFEALGKHSANLDAIPLSGLVSDLTTHDPTLPCKTKQSCRNNPRCLSSIPRPSKNTLDAIVAYQLNSLEDPNHLYTNEKSPKGMKNLGATCYMGTLLQTWFSDKPFRKWVLNVGSNVQGLAPNLYELFRMFAQLEYSNRRYVDPAPLVETLQIQPFIQQDPEEFSILFMSCLDQESRQLQSNFPLKDRFQGTYEYVTTCNTCKRETFRKEDFTSLHVGIKDTPILHDGISALLSPEYLSGPNQYFCEQCQQKRDAQRAIRLARLPPVLHMQLMRFYYDPVDYVKRKSSQVVTFPERLDMRPFLKSAGVYRLKAVLLHRGQSSQAGHYVARIQIDGKWYDFDDETVTEMKKADFDIVDPSAKEPKTSPSKKKQKLDPSSQPKPGEYQSKGAYLLVYELETDVIELNHDTSLRIPDWLQEQNDSLRASVERFNNLKNDITNQAKARLDALNEFLSLCELPSKVVDHPVLLSTENLRKSILYELAELSQEEMKQLEEAKIHRAINNHDLLCSHSRLYPGHLHKCKILAQSAVQILQEKLGYSIDPWMNGDDLQTICRDCLKDIVNAHYSLGQLDAEKKLFSTLMRSKDPSGLQYYLSKRWWNCWKMPSSSGFGSAEISSPNSEPYMYDVFCEHDGLNPNHSQQITITPKAYEFLQARHTDFKSFSTDDVECIICIESRIQNLETTKHQREKAEHEKQELKRFFDKRSIRLYPDQTYFVIPVDFLTSWRRFISVPDTLVPPDGIDTGAFFCKEHGQLVYDFNSDNPKETVGVYVTADEWKTWQECGYDFQDGKTISLKRQSLDDSVTRWFEYLDGLHVCEVCRVNRLLEYDSGVIQFRRKLTSFLGESGEGDDRSQSGEKKNGDVDVIILDQLKQVEPLAVRRSKRNVKSNAANTISLPIKANMTISELKLELLSKVRDCPPPSYQRLFFNDSLLDDNGKSLTDYRIYPGCVLDWEWLEEMDDDMKHASVAELGFAGSVLVSRNGSAESPIRID